MKRPTIPSKPPAPSIHATIGPAIARARRLKPDELPQSEAELRADIERHLGLPSGFLDQLNADVKPDADGPAR